MPGPDTPDWLTTFARAGELAFQAITASESAPGTAVMVAAAVGKVHVVTSFLVTATPGVVPDRLGIRSHGGAELFDATVGVRATALLSPDSPTVFLDYPPESLRWPVNRAVQAQVVVAPGGGKVQVFVFVTFYTRAA